MQIEDWKDISLEVVNFCGKALDLAGKNNWEVSVLFCDDEEIRELNKQYRNVDAPTDVLSFPQGDQYADNETYYAGDIVISLETAERQSKEYDEPKDAVLKRLLVHGIVHLMGFDHKKDEEYAIMKNREDSILSELKGVRIF